MRKNVAPVLSPILTHNGAQAMKIPVTDMLRRSVLSTMLWENTFYEDGELVADRIARLAGEVEASTVAALAYEARSVANLRHVPLLLLLSLIKRGTIGTSDVIAAVIQRPDEAAELLSLYWAKGKRPVSKQLAKGIGKALEKFDAYSLAKNDRTTAAIRLRDVLRIVHPKPSSPERSALYKSIVDGTIAVPDTWEAALSRGADKRETFTRLLSEGKLGYLALLRNLRGMNEAGVDRDLIQNAIRARKGAERVLPFRFVAAARHAPMFEPALDDALKASIAAMTPLPGRTFVLVDVSGSMEDKLSGKSDLTRMDAAATLASVIPSEDLRVFTFSYNLVEVPARRGMAGIEAIIKSQGHGGTDFWSALQKLNKEMRPHDRLIVVTDEQVDKATRIAPVAKRAYLINVASYQNGIGYGQNWVHLDGFSESIIRWIGAYEAEAA